MTAPARGRKAAALAEVVAIETGAPAFTSPDEGRYRLIAAGGRVALEIDFLRREAHQLKGELQVTCSLPGVRTIDGVLAVGDLNLSSTRARQGHAKYLAELASTAVNPAASDAAEWGVFADLKRGMDERAGDGCPANPVDWPALVEEFAQRVLAAERRGSPAVLLADLPRVSPDAVLDVEGLPLLDRHPLILFGDGGTAKSYLALWLAGTLAKRGRKVGLFDWELCGEDHRDRLERLFGPEMPPIHYLRCERALVYEADRLRRTIRDHELDYVVLDSVAFACDGKPEDAEVVIRYQQAARRFGKVGSLHVAHVTKAIEGGDLKPFGSGFWHNFGRSTWNVKANAMPGEERLRIALHHRKANLGPKRQSIGFEFTFTGDSTTVRRVDPASVPELAAGLSTYQRVAGLLRTGPLTVAEILDELDGVKPDTARKTIRRAVTNGWLVDLDGDRVGLAHRGAKP